MMSTSELAKEAAEIRLTMLTLENQCRSADMDHVLHTLYQRLVQCIGELDEAAKYDTTVGYSLMDTIPLQTEHVVMHHAILAITAQQTFPDAKTQKILVILRDAASEAARQLRLRQVESAVS